MAFTFLVASTEKVLFPVPALGPVPTFLAIEEWERLKEAYVNAAVDVGNTLAALGIRLRVLEEAERGAFRERLREVRQEMELASLDWSSRFLPFERELERLKPPDGSPIHPQEPQAGPVTTSAS